MRAAGAKSLISFLFILITYALPAHAQQVKITGTVMQAGKQVPIAGAGVTAMGSKATTVTDASGHFRMYVQAKDSILIRAVGYKPLVYKVKQNTPELRLAIMLHEESVQLQEVQVTSMPSEEDIRKALRNMPEKPKMLVQRPGYVPGSEPPPPPPPPLPNIVLNPASYFSKEGTQKRKLKKLTEAANTRRKQLEEARLKAEQEQVEQKYNSFFRDSTSYR
ncbi:carboxypeptidase-like regulatory domain-containing protein [uncultured Pontibacter sp.]|uniref:carboxypeptidase-like regulatory domain-containing protein n=1 Tax=uncultured Pontibacter sp. TaxID=453356 RepID=UPI00260B58F2|nr:carboxypeptidase-like regulatory domain-containing protein [uncultured Pontibacter sp.]